jgi:ABC-type Co2+ transport system permease subunit
MLASFACSLEIGLSGTVDMQRVVFSMAQVHSIIGIAEAVITVLLLKYFMKGEGNE